MTKPFLGKMRRGLSRFLDILFAMDGGPSNLAKSVADRLYDDLTPTDRNFLRQRFGVGPETNSNLEEITVRCSATRQRIREIESKALIRLYCWEHRKFAYPPFNGA